MEKRLNLRPLSLAYASAILAAVGMLVLGIFGNLGIYVNAVEAMTQWHLFFSLNFLGIITGMIEAAFWSFIVGYALAWLYNKL